jgi:4-diphosphocytidyl-2-C-methyl-D-erythritol kinase
MLLTMTVCVPSFAKINLGLRIGARRADGFHELRTVYQTIALHDILRLKVERGSGIEIRCVDARVPTDETNTCYRMLERGMSALRARGRVVLEVDKRLPVQGGLGGASGNAAAALLGLEIALKKQLSITEKLRIGAEVGSDVPLFLVGGTVLGVGRGEEVYPLPDLPGMDCVIAAPEVAVSTPKAFADWDAWMDAGNRAELRSAWTDKGVRPHAGSASKGGDVDRSRGGNSGKLTADRPSDRIDEFSRVISAWLSGVSSKKTSKERLSGVPAGGGGRAEIPLLDLVRTGIENDFERVVFPQYPALRDVKCALEKAGAVYASLSGSGSALYGLFKNKAGAEKAAARLRKDGIATQATVTLTRLRYWKGIQVSSFQP